MSRTARKPKRVADAEREEALADIKKGADDLYELGSALWKVGNDRLSDAVFRVANRLKTGLAKLEDHT